MNHALNRNAKNQNTLTRVEIISTLSPTGNYSTAGMSKHAGPFNVGIRAQSDKPFISIHQNYTQNYQQVQLGTYFEKRKNSSGKQGTHLHVHVIMHTYRPQDKGMPSKNLTAPSSFKNFCNSQTFCTFLTQIRSERPLLTIYTLLFDISLLKQIS